MKLFEPGKMGKMELKNRIVMAPMGITGLCEIGDGRFSQRGIDYFAARARGGVGLIIPGVTWVAPGIERDFPMEYPTIHHGSLIARLNELADTMHQYGAKIALQLGIGSGRVGGTFRSRQFIGASEIPSFWNPSIKTRSMTIEEIEKVVQAYENAARISKIAEIDAIEVRGYGGYIIDTFQTALWNKRTDKYGGDLDGRMRFPLEIIEAIKRGAGDDFPIIYKFTPKHYIEGGRELDEGLEIARRLEKAGVSALHVDLGCYEVWYRTVPTQYEPPASHVHLSEAVKQVVRIPVIVHGKLGNPEIAEKVLGESKADYIALGRPLLAEPEWPRKVRQGRLDEIKPCICDLDGCVGRVMTGKYISCTVNPLTGMEREYALTPAVKRKSVLVIGGGPAGLEAAAVAASRGHSVVLWDKNTMLGGNLLAASVPGFKQDLRPLIEYLSTRVNKLGVKVELMREGTVEAVERMNPDVVIVATGAVPLVPEIPGVGRNNVFSAVDLLLGSKETGETVLVAGGGTVGCETAVYLAQKGKTVTIVGRLLPEEINGGSRMGLLYLVEESKVNVLTTSRLLEIDNDGAVISNNGSRKQLKCDSVVLALGFKPESAVWNVLEDKVPELYYVGDCREPRRILNAIWEGFHAARLI